MTQFDLLKAGYRQLIERGEMTVEEVAAKIRVLDFLASCSKDDRFRARFGVRKRRGKIISYKKTSSPFRRRGLFCCPCYIANPSVFFQEHSKRDYRFRQSIKGGTKSKKPPQPNEAAFSQSSK